MAMTLKNVYSATGNTNVDALEDVADKSRVGYHAVSLTEWSTTSEPSIAAGSSVEINGALYFADTDTAISGSPADGTVYIKFVPDGASCTVEYDTDAPVWDDEKQGWYESATNNRYAEFTIQLSGTGTVFNKSRMNGQEFSFYTGADDENLDYPVGSYMVVGPAANSYDLNETISEVGFTFIGVWVSRGLTNAASNYYLIQRIK